MTAVQNRIPEFEELDVTTATVRITGAGDGLSEALKIQPRAIHLGDEVYYVLRGKCTQVRHDEKDDDVIRVHTIKANRITEVDRDVAEKMLTAAAEELERAKADLEGQLSLDAEAEALRKEAADRGEGNYNQPA